MSLAYSYIRMSTEKQLHGDSLRRQTDLSEKYAEKHGLELVKDFQLQDVGVSAFRGANATTGALKRFLDAILVGQIPAGSFLLVESLDRLSRERIPTAMKLFWDITDNGVSIVTLSDNQVYAAGKVEFAQLIYSLAIMSRANEESSIKSLRVGAAWDAKRQNAITQKMTKICPGWLELADDRLSFNTIETRASIVKELFEKCAAGQGSNSLTRELNERNVPTFGRSKGWIESYVTKILQNRAVLGEFQPYRLVEGKRHPAGEILKDYYPRIVADELFYRAQAGRNNRRALGGGRRGDAVSNLFSKLARCEYCGASMRMVNKGTGPKGGRYLRCNDAVRGLPCVGTGWRYSDFERSFLYFAKEINLSDVLNAVEKNSQRKVLEEKISAATERLRDLKAKRERTFEIMVAGTETTFLATKLDAFENDISSTEAELDQLAKKQSTQLQEPSFTPEEILSQIEQIQAAPSADTRTHRMQLSTKLQGMIATLTVATEGQKPKFAKIRTMLEEQEPDADYRQKILDTINQKNHDSGAYSPTFQVTFVGGLTRRVVVDRKDPTKFEAEVVLTADGSRTVRRRATGTAAK